MDSLAALEMAELTEEQIRRIEQEVEDEEEPDAEEEAKSTGVPLSQIIYKKAIRLRNRARDFAKNYRNCNMVFMVGSAFRAAHWHVADLRQISNDPVWEIALRDFIQESFREKDRNPKKKAKLKNRRKLPVSSNQAGRPVASRMQGEEDLLFSADGGEKTGIDGEEEGDCATSPVRGPRPRRGQAPQLDLQSGEEADALGEQQPDSAGNIPSELLNGGQTGHEIVAAAAVGDVAEKDANAVAAQPTATGPVAEAGEHPGTESMLLANPSSATVITTVGIASVAAPEMAEAAGLQEPAVAAAPAVPGPSAPVATTRAGREQKPNSRYNDFAAEVEEQPIAKKQKVPAPTTRKEKLTDEENEQLKKFILEAHEEKSKATKNASGYRLLARTKMFNAYATDPEHLARIKRVLHTDQTITTKVESFFGNEGTASFPHVKEAAEANKKEEEEEAAKAQEKNAIGCFGAPGHGQTGVELLSWISKFKNAFMENTSENEFKFRPGVEEAQVHALADRVDMWIANHKSPSYLPSFKNFKADLHLAFQETFAS
ncbi:hypothetical protein NADE_004850 [Nannochloris sp. 'desiccata']|nr:hypothetical protein KSW81_001476 [Chlorella desiccata (nom. nud.)]KAG7672517.1 hypothetical protein KSW81_001479 [Chlorella desiccata (nom. nud.)]KAH7616857.1 hypothetical protein NADE_001664 [Chlorella desiccata (nom. nud.)]KAH7616860.1 hypothetical protein NADE_001667 [Chlorella desiccata (nom. nud.)]KAH7619820.1 hypothetical protein NADE_008101 [Chlorella desiccata (nom. nud.)]